LFNQTLAALTHKAISQQMTLFGQGGWAVTFVLSTDLLVEHETYNNFFYDDHQKKKKKKKKKKKGGIFFGPPGARRRRRRRRRRLRRHRLCRCRPPTPPLIRNPAENVAPAIPVPQDVHAQKQ